MPDGDSSANNATGRDNHSRQVVGTQRQRGHVRFDAAESSAAGGRRRLPVHQTPSGAAISIVGQADCGATRSLGWRHGRLLGRRIVGRPEIAGLCGTGGPAASATRDRTVWTSDGRFFLFPSAPCRIDCFASSSWIKQVFAFLLHRVNQHFGFTHILLVFLFQLLRGSIAR